MTPRTEKEAKPMRLKILNRFGNVKNQFDVVTLKEAYQLLELHAKTQDKGYLYIESSMKLPIEAPKVEKVVKQEPETIITSMPFVFAENGRRLSKQEINRLVGNNNFPLPKFTSMGKQGFIKSEG